MPDPHPGAVGAPASAGEDPSMASAGLPLQAAPTAAEAQAPPDDAGTPERKLRLWPAIAIVLIQWVVYSTKGFLPPGTTIQMAAIMWTPMLVGVAIVVWWLAASRAPWRERGLGLFAWLAAGAITVPFYHPSFRAIGTLIYAVPVVATTWVAWLLVSGSMRWPSRRAGLALVFLLTWGYFALLRFDGIDGSMQVKLSYRGTPTGEDKFLAEFRDRDAVASAESHAAQATLALGPGDWPCFRGPYRDSRLPGVSVRTDWSEEKPPRRLWRHRVGPGWSSFAVVGNRAFTQEQRGQSEVVICYDVGSGSPIWVHGDNERFEETIGGPGPRATPTFHEGRLYTQGAKGRLNCLDATSGEVIWSRDLVADSGAAVPNWGFSSSPLVARGLLSVFAGGPDGKSVMAYDAQTGEPAWSSGEAQLSYCSLQLSTLAGVEQLLLTSEKGATAFDPQTGNVLWQHEWPLTGGMARVTQPAVIGDSDILIGTFFGLGLRRVHVEQTGDGWRTDSLWTTKAIKPYFSDFVIHDGHIYGFDSAIFMCVRLEDGKPKWRTRGYGSGQVLLLPDQNLLLVLSEQGEVALLRASPSGHEELCKFQAIEGKTWNHPVLSRGKLLVRNGEEAACYELAEGESAAPEI